LFSLFHHPDIMRLGYGIHGLYSRDGETRRLESVHVLLPFADHTTGDVVPLVGACLKAPWNAKEIGATSVRADWESQRWGIELAVLIDAVRVFFDRELYSFGEQIVSNWRMGFLFPAPDHSNNFSIPFQELRDYLGSLTLPGLRADINIFGVAVGDMAATGLGIFPNLGKDWITYGFRIDASTAERLVKTYLYWMDQIFMASRMM
jgi:hypothetical protein